MKGYQTAIASWLQIIGGLLFALSELFRVLTECLTGSLDIGDCFDALPPLAIAVAIAANGLGTLGLGSKVEEVKDTTKKIETKAKATDKVVDEIAATTAETAVTAEKIETSL